MADRSYITAPTNFVTASPSNAEGLMNSAAGNASASKLGDTMATANDAAAGAVAPAASGASTIAGTSNAAASSSTSDVPVTSVTQAQASGSTAKRAAKRYTTAQPGPQPGGNYYESPDFRTHGGGMGGGSPSNGGGFGGGSGGSGGS